MKKTSLMSHNNKVQQGLVVVAPCMARALANPDRLAGKAEYFRELQIFGGRGPGCGKSNWLRSWYNNIRITLPVA